MNFNCQQKQVFLTEPILYDGRTPILYDAHNIDDLNWPETEDGQCAKRYFVPLIKKGVKNFIENINASISLLQFGNCVFPLLIVDNEYDNSYVCSPYGHYISLAIESLHLFDNSWVRAGMESSLKGIGKILKMGMINNIVYINHWLFSTDLHPKDIAQNELENILCFLQKKFPFHAIAFRSINSRTNKEFKERLQDIGFSLLMSRHIYLTDAADESLFKTRIVKSDLKLFRETDFEIISKDQLDNRDCQRILDLYKMLSIEQHSDLNPQLNLKFINMIIDQNILEIKALKRQGMIEGVIGYMQHDQTLLCPFIGYDKCHPEKTKLYRLLSTLLLLEAAKKKALFHQSAGASFYKKIRRAIGCQEYLGVYSRHLPYKQKMVWGLLQCMMNFGASHLMKKY